MKYKVEFYTKGDVYSCKQCRLRADYHDNYNWKSSHKCTPFDRFVDKFYNKGIKPNWCPLVKIEDDKQQAVIKCKCCNNENVEMNQKCPNCGEIVS